MIEDANLSGKLAFDAKSLDQLKQSAKENSPEAIKTVAKQFEAIMMNMMLKSMREATPQDGVFDNEQSRMFTSMLDQQLTSNLTAKGLGLADVLARQLGYVAPNRADEHTPLKSTLLPLATMSKASAGNNFEPLLSMEPLKALEKIADPIQKALTEHTPSVKDMSNSVKHFLDKMLVHAKAASQSTGMPPALMLSQAALESGWGKREIKDANGNNSYNLFGIKATGNWKGKVAESMTTEYINGVKQKRIEKFKAYDNYADSFKDFANLMQNNPRYEQVMANTHNPEGYANAMQKAGYATDPQYAKKLLSVIKKMMD